MRSCYGTIWPICAESAVKPQSTNLYLAITWSSSMTTLSAALCRELCMLCLCTTPSTYTPDWWTWWSDVEWITETERQCSSWLALSNSSVAYALARDCLVSISDTKNIVTSSSSSSSSSKMLIPAWWSSYAALQLRFDLWFDGRSMPFDYLSKNIKVTQIRNALAALTLNYLFI